MELPISMPAQSIAATEQADFVTALARGLSVIRAFGADAPRMTLAEISRRVGLPRATVRRSLITLEALGYVEIDDHSFALTPRVLSLGHSYLASTPLPRIVQPFLEKLSRTLEEACSVAIFDDDAVVMIARVAPKRLLSLANVVGSRLPAYCTGSGFMLLANLTDDALEAYLRRLKPHRYTPKTVTDIHEIRRLVLAARVSGYAISDGGIELGVCAIAVPLVNSHGRAIGVLNAVGYMDRISPAEMVERFLPLLRRTVEEIRPSLV